MQLWTEEFNRIGVHRLVELILAWRGEIFLESVLRDEVAYDVPRPLRDRRAVLN